MESDRSAGKNGIPVNGIAASGVRSAKKIPKPAAVPATAATTDSTAAISEICRGVAPASRIAANRCSRRAADSRVAVAMKISTGNSSASATTDRMRSTPRLWTPIRTSQFAPVQALGGVVLMLVTSPAPGTRESWAAVCPTMTTRLSGPGRAASPTRPA
jgi:hypothetical protein